MAQTKFHSFAKDNGGRVSLLLLLFLLAIYEFINAGFSAFAIVCAIPFLVLAVIAVFRYRMLTFWMLVVVNYILMWHSAPLPSGIPTSLYNEMFEIILIALAIIDVKDAKFERCGNIMLYTILIWGGFCTLEVLNDTCGIGIDVANWFTTARSIAYQIIYAFLVYTLYITNSKLLIKYLYVWAGLSLFAGLPAR